MASPKPTLTVIRSPIANDELHGIWRWNAQRYSPSHDDTYLRYLERGIDGLDREYARGKNRQRPARLEVYHHALQS